VASDGAAAMPATTGVAMTGTGARLARDSSSAAGMDATSS
jgi:hypothetical protein